jgi:EAL domain-containing protein (putative c-di-GMP-specific phosphodiesterase class I)
MTAVARLTLPTHVERALVVDDDPHVRRVVTRQLQQLGVQHVDTAADGSEAMRAVVAADSPFGVVICDLRMPHEDGIEFLRRLAQTDRRPGVILLSGEDAPLLDAARRLGFSRNLNVLGVVSKPHTREALGALLERLDGGAAPPVHAQASSAPSRLGAAELADMLREGCVEVWFQPQLDLASQRVLALEALARLRHPARGLLLPATFIPTAEEHGLIVPLTAAVTEQAVTWSRAWQEAGSTLSVSVNLSAAGLHDLAYPDALAGLCARQQVDPSRIVLELTESALAIDATAFLEIVTRLRLKKFRLSIDDFGTAYSSLDQLRSLPFSELKIDSGFVRDAARDERSRRMLGATLDLARQLALTTVAEGVESDAQLQMVTDLGCDIAQGYLIARPMPGREVSQWLATRSSSTLRPAGTAAPPVRRARPLGRHSASSTRIQTNARGMQILR